MDHPDLIVGAASGDDAAVWRLDDRRALVVTVDFITPLVDEPALWGRIAAANAVSDVYAMGGAPLLAMNVVGWHTDVLSVDLLVEVLEGAAELGREGGWLTVGGHTVDDPEPKFGLAVVGEVHPEQVLTNAALLAGQRLVLTKPLGVGVITTALKAGAATAEVVDGAVASMVRLNARAAQAARTAGAVAATDITGFGLLGHARKMAEASGVDLALDTRAVPLLPGARDLAAAGYVPGGSRRNLSWAQERLDTGGVDPLTVQLLADAQTSGGLLFGADGRAAEAAVAELRADGHDAAVIGEVLAGAGRLHLR